MLADRYGLTLSTSSDAAREAYVEGCDLLLTAYPGAVPAFDRSIAADPGFALAHVAKARALQMGGDISSAKESLAKAKALSDGLHEREAGQIEIFHRLFSGPADAALTLIRSHLAAWPRDALVLSTTASQLGLIGLSGRPGREQELVDLLDSLATHYGDDWWFNAHHAMALSETSQQAAAHPKIERSIAQYPQNAYAAHALGHLYYEMNEHDAAAAFMKSWLSEYPRAGGLRGHLHWHLALSHLQSGNSAEALDLFTDAFVPEESQGRALVMLADAASLLWRSELAGHPRDPARWQAVHAFAHEMFPQAGGPMADWHIALADAVTGDDAALDARTRQIDAMVQARNFPCGPAVPALLRGIAAFERQDYAAAIDAIEPMLPERERIGGSRAQVDLVEFTLMRAYLISGRRDDVQRLLDKRRPGPMVVPVAGMEMAH